MNKLAGIASAAMHSDSLVHVSDNECNSVHTCNALLLKVLCSCPCWSPSDGCTVSEARQSYYDVVAPSGNVSASLFGFEFNILEIFLAHQNPSKHTITDQILHLLFCLT